MFTEILKIIPKLSSNDLNQMDRTLSSRFGRIAKKFGKGISGAFGAAGLTGLALGLVDKLLNPLKETQEAIDRTLKNSDDLVTNAKQFGTEAGKLFKLQQLAASTGLEADNLFMLINKFQTAVAEAQADPTKKTSVRQFVGEKDTADAFFQFIQSLQKMDKSQQLLVQQEVFGEKQVLKMADFLQTDFAAQTKLIGAKFASAYTPGLEKLGGLNDLSDALTAKRTLEDTLNKSKIINQGMVLSKDAQERAVLERENNRINQYQNLASIAVASEKISGLVEQGVGLLGTIIEKFTGITTLITNLTNKLSGSRFLRGIFGGDGK